MLVVPGPDAASVLSDSALRPYRRDLDLVTADIRKPPRFRGEGTGPVVLIRPDGHVAARGRPGSMHAVTGYLRDLFTDPAGQRLGELPAESALHAARGTAAAQQ